MIFVNFQLSRLQREIESMWNDADEEVRNTYGREYYDVLSKGLEECKPEGCPTVDPVTEAFVDAITAFNPQYRYLVKGGSGLFDVYYVSIKLKQKVPHRPKNKYHTVEGKKYHTVGEKKYHTVEKKYQCRKKQYQCREKSTTLSEKKYHTLGKKYYTVGKKYHTV
jgi:hypothetical protein